MSGVSPKEFRTSEMQQVSRAVVAAPRPGLGCARPGLRVHIVGGPGTGKTTLSRALARELGIEAIELDLIAGDGEPPDFVPTTPLARRIASVQQTASRDSWVTEGAFLWWTEALFEAACVIVWIDVPRVIAEWRLARRYCQERLASLVHSRNASEVISSALHPHISDCYQFSRWSWRYYDQRRAIFLPEGDDPDELSWVATNHVLQRYHTKVVRVGRKSTTASTCKLITSRIGVLHVAHL